MQNRGLIFIPDISGFTRFVNETEIEHSRQIIQELLEILINANHIGLEISEIEGDAILFYKFGEAPDLALLYRQVQDMFCAFHRYIIAYDNRRYCYCKACNAAVQLSLKVITHYGEFTGYNVKSFNKLIGKDIIVAHQLLKNDIEQHEYWLITKNLVQHQPPAGLPQWIQWNSSAKHTESGDIYFHYALLSRLKNDLQPEQPPQPELSQKIKVLSVSEEYETDIITLFHATGDFRYRHRWQDGVKAVEEIDHYLPRVGMRCRCILDNGETVIYSTSYLYHPDKILFSETDEKKNNCICYTLEKTGPRTTRLTLDIYQKKNMLRQLGFSLTGKKQAEHRLQQSLRNLHQLVKEIHLP